MSFEGFHLGFYLPGWGVACLFWYVAKLCRVRALRVLLQWLLLTCTCRFPTP